jgi:heme/copper-type cytochrome/quinol oxidase subunit 2
MVSPNMPPRQTPAAMSTSGGTAGSYVDWAVVLAGGVLALAVTFLLMSFGASLGLSLTSPYRGEGVSASWLAIAAGIWFVWVVVTAFGAGGYLAGRMRRHAGDATADGVEVRDGAHGLLVWATGALVSTVLATMGATGVVSMGASAVGSAVGSGKPRPAPPLRQR